MENILKRGILFLFAIVLFIRMSYAQTRVEGLFYLDSRPVSIEIKDGMTDRGSLEPGKRADLILFSMKTKIICGRSHWM